MTDSRNTPLFLFAGISSGIALFYLGFLSSRYNFDGTLFSFFLAQAVQSGRLGELLHPHHLFYGPATYLFYKSLTGLGINISIIVSLQILDTLFAFFTILLFLVFCYRLTQDRFITIVSALLLSFSFGFWFFSVEPEVYVPHAFFLYSGLAALWFWSRPGPQPAWYIRAVMLGIMAVFIITNHLSSGLFLISAGWGCLWYFRNAADQSLWNRFRKGITPALVMALVTFGILVPIYILSYRATPLSKYQDFVRWFFGATNPDTGLGYRDNIWKLSPVAIKLAAFGYEDTFLAGSPHRYIGFPGLGILRTITVVGILGGVVLYLLSLPGLIRKDKRTQVILLLFLIPLAAFNVVWDSLNYEVKVGVLPGFWLAVAISAAEVIQRVNKRSYRALIRFALVVVLITLFAHNFFSSIRPGVQPELNKDLQRAYFVRDHTEPNAVVYFAGVGSGYGIGKIYLIYFAGRQTRIVNLILGRIKGPFPQPLVWSMYEDRDRPIYVLSELLETGPAVKAVGTNHHIDPQKISGFFKSLDLALVAKMDDGFAIYRLNVGSQVPPQ